MTAPENPLTARVFVNRLWKMYFGTGLSRNLDDLGAQGEWPQHLDLLDWLSAEFMAGWDVKHLARLMVTSAAYRRSADSTPLLEERDPFNRLLTRQSRHRLDAEFIRDNALAISGLLVEKQGGPSVKPVQPAGYWAYLNFPGANMPPTPATASTGAAFTPTGSGPSCIQACWPSTRPRARNAPSAARSPTLRSRRSCS